MGKDALETVSGLLLIIGGLNWGLVGLLNLNLVTLIFGFMPVLVTLVYVLVGLSALYMLYAMYMKK